MNEQSFEQNSTPADPNLKNYRKDFSIVGLALFITLGLEFAISLFVSYYVIPDVPDLADTGKIWYWLYVIAVQYVICMPIGIIMLRMNKKQTAVCASAKLEASSMLTAVAISFAFIYVGSYISNFINTLTESAFGIYSQSSMPSITNWTSAGMYFLTAVVLAPVMEELLFRKSVIDVLRPYGEKTAVVISALIFALAHQNIAQMAYAFLCGLAFGWIYIRTGKLRYSMIIHILINFISGFVTTFAQGMMMDTEALSEIYSNLSNLTGGYGYMYGEFSTDMLAEIADMFEQIYNMIPGLIIVMISSAITMGFAIAGFVLFLANRKKLKFRKGEITIRREDKGSVIFMAPGMMIFIIFSIAMIALSFFMY